MKKTFTRILSLLLVVFGYATTTNAQADIFAVSPYEDSIWAIDTNGVDSRVSAMALVHSGGSLTCTGANGLALRENTGDYYAMLKLSGVTGRVLSIVDPWTGIYDTIGNTGENIAQITFVDNNTMMGVSGDGGNTSEALFYININDGSLGAPIATGGAGSDGETIGYCPDNGKVYRWSGRDSNPAMEEWDMTDSSMTTVTRSGFNYDEPFSVLYIGDGKFLMANLDQEFITVDTTGFAVLDAVSTVGSVTSNGYIKGMAPIGRFVNTTAADTVCYGYTDTLVASNGISFQWYLNGAAITGATNQSYIASQSGIYNCVIENLDLVPTIDSAATGINFHVLAALGDTITQTVCAGDSIVVNGVTYNSTVTGATETVNNIGPFGCDSTIVINLTVLSPIVDTLNQTITCGDSIVVNGTTYNTTTTGAVELFTNGSVMGCDSTVVVNLTVNPKAGSIDQTICDGDSIVVNGTVYNTTVTGATETFTNIGPMGCDSIVTINLTVQAPVDATVTTAFPSITANAAGASYQWLDCDNNLAPIPGANGQTFTAQVDGNYAVEVTEGSCADTSACESIIGIGIEELANSNISVYPNPVTTTLTIDLSKVSNGTSLIEIVSTEGKLVFKQTVDSNTKLNIDVNEWSKGIYFVKVNGSDSIFKLIKE